MRYDYDVSWEYLGGPRSSYSVRMNPRQAKRVESRLDATPGLKSSSVKLRRPANRKSFKDIMAIIREGFL